MTNIIHKKRRIRINPETDISGVNSEENVLIETEDEGDNDDAPEERIKPEDNKF